MDGMDTMDDMDTIDNNTVPQSISSITSIEHYTYLAISDSRMRLYSS